MDIAHWLDRGAIALKLHANSKRQALAGLAEVAARTLGRPAPEIFETLNAREAEGSTGVGHGVALPHARLERLDGMRAVFARLETPVDFDALDGQPVDLMFALFAPDHAGVEHLRALARVSRTLRRASLREQLRKTRTADAVYALLSLDVSPSAA
jgi:PTS system nitrogen regulatory IIA component